MSRTDSNLRDLLGDPTRILKDPRLDPRIRTAMQMDREFAPGVEPVRVDANYEDCAAFEKTAAVEHPQQLAAMPDVDTVATSIEVIHGDDGNDISLYVHQCLIGKARSRIVHIHGGGMVWGSAQDPMYVRFRNESAVLGLVVVGVEFRNSAGKLGNHPFPAGLDDCVAAVRWTHANRANLNLSAIVISGESGGGNLSLATAIKSVFYLLAKAIAQWCVAGAAIG